MKKAYCLKVTLFKLFLIVQGVARAKKIYLGNYDFAGYRYIDAEATYKKHFLICLIIIQSQLFIGSS
jgi:hypothetical protein